MQFYKEKIDLGGVQCILVACLGSASASGCISLPFFGVHMQYAS
jgi:hypothetical protein